MSNSHHDSLCPRSRCRGGRIPFETMTYEEATHQTNIAILRRLVKTYGINRSLGNVLTNEESILQAIKGT